LSKLFKQPTNQLTWCKPVQPTNSTNQPTSQPIRPNQIQFF
jgi:hypothetical protein